MPLYNFIKVITTQDLQWLVIEGSPTQEQLNAAWNEIFMEYCDLSPSPAQQYLFNLTKDIKVIEGRLEVINAVCNQMLIDPRQEYIDILVEYGFYFDYTEETLGNDIEQVLIQARSLLVQRQVKEGEYLRYQEQHKGESITEYDYDEQLAVLSKNQGYQLRSKDLTVTQFVAIFNRFKADNKHGIKSED